MYKSCLKRFYYQHLSIVYNVEVRLKTHYLNIVHDDSALFCICASQYLEFEGKSFCALLYTHYRACSTYVWHGLIWNPSVTGGKSAKLLILLYQSQYLSADDKIF